MLRKKRQRKNKRHARGQCRGRRPPSGPLNQTRSCQRPPTRLCSCRHEGLPALERRCLHYLAAALKTHAQTPLHETTTRLGSHGSRASGQLLRPAGRHKVSFALFFFLQPTSAEAKTIKILKGTNNKLITETSHSSCLNKCIRMEDV